MASPTKLINSSEKVLSGLLGLGLFGILMLIVYGNLSGNLGFTPESVTIIEEADGFINSTGYTLDGASDTGFASLSVTGAFGNLSDGSLNNTAIDSGNYSASAAGVITNATASNWIGVLFNYTYSRTRQAEINSDNVIDNLTSGTNTFFGFSGTFFTLTAISLLIGIILVVIKMVKGNRSGGRSGEVEKLTG
jgi:hypothetical protein